MNLRRTGGWARKVPLRSRTQITGSSPSARSSRLTRKAITSKRKPPSAEEKAAKELLRERSGGVCEGCDQRRADDPSHRVRNGQGGAWCVTNLVALCRPCHEWLHDNETTQARRLGWALRSHENPVLEPVFLARHGRVLLRPDGSFTPVSGPELEAS